MSSLEGQEMQESIVVFWRVWIKGLQEGRNMLLANTDSDLTIYLEIKSCWAFCGTLLEALGAGR